MAWGSPAAAAALQTALGIEHAAWAAEVTRALPGFAALNPGARKADHRWPASASPGWRARWAPGESLAGDLGTG